MHTAQDIPAALRPEAEAAVSWINATRQTGFELTGLVDYDEALDADADDAREFGVVLCDGEICTREQVRVRSAADGWQFSLVEAGVRDIPPLLDPPAGVRLQWLTDAIAKHEFVLLLFYRGLW